jgi:hypothetical protein
LRRAAGLALGTTLAAAVSTGAQTRASLDAGASYVEYSGFLPSASFSLTPAVRASGERYSLLARGTWLRFESGNSSVQGLLAGSLFVPATRSLVAEVGTELGASRYQDFARFSHALGRARLQLRSAGGGGGWIGGTLGTAASDSGRQTVGSVDAGAWLAGNDVTVAFAATGTFTADRSYADLETTLRHTRPSGFEAVAILSARAGDPFNDAGPFLEATLTIPLVPHAALVLAGGHYPGDPVRGNVAGDYVSAAFRLVAPIRARPPVTIAIPKEPISEDMGTALATLLEVRSGRGSGRTLVFRVAGATQVDIMADFTDWLPMPLLPAGADGWSISLAVTPGRHRLNLRVNGGPWIVPAGTLPIADDFQGVVGAVVIP